MKVINDIVDILFLTKPSKSACIYTRTSNQRHVGLAPATFQVLISGRLPCGTGCFYRGSAGESFLSGKLLMLWAQAEIGQSPWGHLPTCGHRWACPARLRSGRTSLRGGQRGRPVALKWGSLGHSRFRWAGHWEAMTPPPSPRPLHPPRWEAVWRSG